MWRIPAEYNHKYPERGTERERNRRRYSDLQLVPSDRISKQISRFGVNHNFHVTGMLYTNLLNEQPVLYRSETA